MALLRLTKMPFKKNFEKEKIFTNDMPQRLRYQAFWNSKILDFLTYDITQGSSGSRDVKYTVYLMLVYIHPLGEITNSWHIFIPENWKFSFWEKKKKKNQSWEREFPFWLTFPFLENREIDFWIPEILGKAGNRYGIY